MASSILTTRYCEGCSRTLGKEFGLPCVVVQAHKVGAAMRCEYCHGVCGGRVLTDEEAMAWDTDTHAHFWLRRFFPEELERRKDWTWTKDGSRGND